MDQPVNRLAESKGYFDANFSVIIASMFKWIIND